MRFPQVAVRLPDWVEDTLSEEDGIYPVVEDRVRLAIELSRSNIRHGIGEPFGAAIFERETGQLLACGVNLVTSLGCSIFHAEMVAIMVAQSMIGDFDLGGPGRPMYELVVSTEPYAMCLGAAPWSGVRHLVCGARDEDAERVGFDEGAKSAEWVPTLERRCITVQRDVLRDEAASVLQEYAAEKGGEIYDARRGGS
jgi:tRNA(Arg) A34 adenosine deaminase TadA